MKKVDEIKYLAEWASWAKDEEKKAKEQETALVVTPKNGENLPAPSKPTCNPIQNLKENPIPIVLAAVAINFVPVVGQFALGSLVLASSRIDKKQVKYNYYLLKSITAPIINKQVSVVEHWMDDETKFFVNVTMPLFVIIRDSHKSSKFIDYVKSIKDRRPVKASEYSSEKIYELIQLMRKNDKPNLVIEEFIPTTSEYEELWRAIKKKDLDRFVEKLPLHAKDREIYSFCYHYEELQREYLSFNMMQKFNRWVEIRVESCRIAEKERVKAAAKGDVLEYEFSLPSAFKPELMENMRADTLRMLLYAQRIPLTDEQRKELDELMKIPVVVELYNEAMGVDPDADVVDEIFRSDLDEATHKSLTDLIAKYFENNQHKARGKECMEVDAIAQKSVVLLLKDEGLLAPSTSDKTTHSIATRLIQQIMNSEHNIRSSNSYNKTEEYQIERKKRHAVREKISSKIEEFNDFERALKKILAKNE